MITLYLTLLIPVFGALVMLCIGKRKIAGIINILLTGTTFLTSLWLAKVLWQTGYISSPHEQFYVDSLSILSIVLATFIAATTAVFSNGYMLRNLRSKRIGPNRFRLYHIMYQLFLLAVLLTLSSNNIGIIWVAMEGATLATVLLVSLYRTPQAIEAAWKYFVLCIVGIALALFGTILVYASSEQITDSANTAILWHFLYQHAANLDPSTIKIAFAFLLIGYGTKMGLVPMHNWLPDAYSESPAPVSALLSGLLSNVALYALIRFKILVDLALHNHLAGNLMMGFGLFSFIVAAILLHRQNNIKRLFSYSSIEHMGMMTFAFGLGGVVATFSALFYMLMHSLVKSSIFVTIGNISQITGTQSMDKIRGILKARPVIGWSLILATVAICGLPPFGIFISEFLVFISTVKSFPILGVILIFGLIVALAGLFRHIHPVVYGDPGEAKRVAINIWPVILHLGIVFALGIYIPSVLAVYLNQAVQIIVH